MNTVRKRLLNAAAAVIVLAAVGLMLAWILLPPSRITPENLERVKADMTEREVIDILGRPTERQVGSLIWEGPDMIVDIYIDEGKVSAIMHGPQRSFSQKLRRWLKR